MCKCVCYTYIYICVCVCVCVYKYIYKGKAAKQSHYRSGEPQTVPGGIYIYLIYIYIYRKEGGIELPKRHYLQTR